MHRFEILSQIGDLKDKNILDVGCGFGDFYDYLVNRKKIPIGKYIGIYINSEIVNAGKKRYPEIQLLCADILNLHAIKFCINNGKYFSI